MKAPVVDDGEKFQAELQESTWGSDTDVAFARTFEETAALLTVNSYDIVI